MYCVIKNTTIVIHRNEAKEVMLKDAINSGLTEVEVLTEEEYQARKATEPIPHKEPTIEEKNRADIDYLGIMTGVDLNV